MLESIAFIAGIAGILAYAALMNWLAYGNALQCSDAPNAYSAPSAAAEKEAYEAGLKAWGIANPRGARGAASHVALAIMLIGWMAAGIIGAVVSIILAMGGRL